MSVWWLRLGISIERIRPGHPRQNGRHERMHLTLNRSGGKFLLANAVQAIAAAEQGHGAERLNKIALAVQVVAEARGTNVVADDSNKSSIWNITWMSCIASLAHWRDCRSS
jgi:hypothetical protein